jgi:hypothetical protein
VIDQDPAGVIDSSDWSQMNKSDDSISKATRSAPRVPTQLAFHAVNKLDVQFAPAKKSTNSVV